MTELDENNLIDFFSKRRTIHEYKKEPVSWDRVKKALSIALLVPNHRLTYPWFFQRVFKEQREFLAHRTIELQEITKPMTSILKEKTKEKFLNPSELIVLGVKNISANRDSQKFINEKEQLLELDKIQKREDYATVACGVQNICLYLSQYDIGTKWSSGAITRDSEMYSLLKIPKEIEVVGFLWIGVPLRIPPCPKKPNLETFLVE